ncbi:4Fe-4S binding protein [Nonomuraea sp. NPDC050394]|uniref:NuoI/complex I 23 kDa subunit family protein n=1 Tax=Nonomuraea sp. NPDC050394 TaxID=3364363 RepID=UPI003795A3B5
MLRRSVTRQYPEVKPALPPRSRGVIALVEENCTSCMLCARECPDWCIYIDSHKETLPAPEGGRPRQRNVLDRFAIDFALCMYCGICIEVCPFDALFWSPEFEYAEGDIRNLLHEKEQLGTWVETVPPPPAHDAGAEPPKELTAAPRRPSGTAGPSARPAPSDTPTPRRTRDTPAGKPPPEGPAPRETSTEGSLPEVTPTDASLTEPSLTETTSTGAKPTKEPPAGTKAAGTPEPPPGEASTGAKLTGKVPETPQADASTGGTPEADVSTDKPSTGAAEEPAGRRPRRPATNVRGIRPPGTLPDPAGRTPEKPAQDMPEKPAQDTPAEPAQDTPEKPAPPDGAPETGPADEGGQLSTGEQSGEELSTGSGESSRPSDSGEQTSAASPRRRRMADPRSIRPPGQLRPDETQESEEDS